MTNIASISPQVNNFLKINLISVEEFLANPAGTLERYLSKKQLQVLDYFMNMERIHGEIYVSQSRIASIVKTTREWVCKTIKKLCDMGLIHKEYRYLDTCIYCVSCIFDDLHIRESLKHLIRSFLFLPIKLLMIKYKPSFSKSSHYTYNDLYKLLTLNSFLTLNPSLTLNSSLKISTSKESSMKQEIPFDKKQEILDEVSKIIPLSEVVRATLAVYPEDVLAVAFKSLKNCKNIDNKVRYFLGICQNQYQQREQRKLWEKDNPKTNAEPRKEQRYDSTKRSTSSTPQGNIEPKVKWKKLDMVEEQAILDAEYKTDRWKELERRFGKDNLVPPMCTEVPVRPYKIIRTEYGMRRVINPEYMDL